METPSPIIMEKPFMDNSKLKTQNIFDIITNKNNSYKIIFNNFSNFIQIKTNFEKDLAKKEFIKNYFLEDLKSNKYFSIFDSVDEIYDQIILDLNNSGKKIIEEENNTIAVIIPVNNIKIKQIEFTLAEKIKTDKDLIQDLFVELNNLKQKFDKLENENIDIRNENKNMRNEINELKEENKKLNEKINSFINSKNNTLDNFNQNDLLNKSSILKSNIDGVNKISNWIKAKIKKNSISFNLVFNMKENGDKGTDFHKYCDNKGATLILVKSKRNNIFGGFTPLDWGKDKEPRPKDYSNQTFIFSLNRNKVFDIRNINGFAIRRLNKEGQFLVIVNLKLEKI